MLKENSIFISHLNVTLVNLSLKTIVINQKEGRFDYKTFFLVGSHLKEALLCKTNTGEVVVPVGTHFSFSRTFDLLNIPQRRNGTVYAVPKEFWKCVSRDDFLFVDPFSEEIIIRDSFISVRPYYEICTEVQIRDLLVKVDSQKEILTLGLEGLDLVGG